MSAKDDLNVSVIDPIAHAIETMKITCFKPFDLAKWFVIGFCAWLANLGNGKFNFRPPLWYRSGNGFNQAVQQVRNFAVEHLFWIVLIGLSGLAVMIVIGLVLTWLSSRGKFMFLYCVSRNKAQIKYPWDRFKQQGNSLFLFRFFAGLLFFVFVMLFVAVNIVSARAFDIGMPALLFPIFASIVIGLLTAIAYALVLKFTNDFVVPMMYLHSCNWLEGWRRFAGLLNANKGRFILYLLFQIVIHTVFFVIIVMVILLSCCCAACIFAVPYIGTVFLLPLLIFIRAYPLHYLRQFGPAYDCFVTQENTIA